MSTELRSLARLAARFARTRFSRLRTGTERIDGRCGFGDPSASRRVRRSGVRGHESGVSRRRSRRLVRHESTSPHACGLAARPTARLRSPQLRPSRRTRPRLRARRTARVVDRLSPRGIDCIALARRHVSARIAGKRRLASLSQNGRSPGLVAVAAARRRSVGRNRQRSRRRESSVCSATD